MRLTSLMGFLADDLAVDLGTANTLVVRPGARHRPERALDRGHEGRRGARGGARGQGHAGPRAGHDLGRCAPLRHGVNQPTSTAPRRCSTTHRQDPTATQHRHPARGGHRALPASPRSRKRRGASVGAPGGRPRGLPHRGADRGGAGRRAAGGRAGSQQIVDIGGGTTEVAVMSLVRHRIYCKSVRIAGAEMNSHRVIRTSARATACVVASGIAEEIKLQAQARPTDPGVEHLTMEVRGRDLIVGIPRPSWSPAERSARRSASRSWPIV